MNNRASRAMKVNRSINEAYKKANPEVAPIEDKLRQANTICQDRNPNFPPTLDYDVAHVKRCQKCISWLLTQGIVFPRA
jgi:hypothetical protein